MYEKNTSPIIINWSFTVIDTTNKTVVTLDKE